MEFYRHLTTNALMDPAAKIERRTGATCPTTDDVEDAELRGERVLRETLFAPQRGNRRSDNVLFHCMNLQKAFYPDEPRIGAPG